MPQTPGVALAAVAEDAPTLSPATAPAFRTMFVAEVSYVGRSLRRLGVRERDLEDLAHDVFLIAYRHFSDYDPSRPLRPWLFGIAARVALAYRRRAGHQREELKDDLLVVDEQPLADDQLAAHQARRIVIRALDAVDCHRRPVLVMHDIDGYAMPEIVEALGIPLDTGYSRLRLARREFAAEVKRLQRGPQ